MKHPEFKSNWPVSWRESYFYDQQEIWGEVTQYGYAYAYGNRQRITLSMIEEVLSRGSTILDIAAAQGNFSLSLAERGYRVTWNDLRGDLADYVRLKHENGELSFAPGNAFDQCFNHPFDCVLITEIIEHVAHPDQFLQKIATLVRPGGYVVMTTPNGAYFRNTLPRFSDCSNPEQYESVQFKPNSDGHIFLLWPDELDLLARQAGLNIDRRELFTTPLTNGHIKLGHLLRFMPKRCVLAVERAAQALPITIKKRLMVHAAVRYQRKSVQSVG